MTETHPAMAAEPDTIDDASDSSAGDVAPVAPAEPPKKRPPLVPPSRRGRPEGLGPWEPVVRFGYVALVAVLVALVAMRVNRPRQAELSGVEPGIDPLLMQPVKTTEVNMTSIRWAVEGLNKASPVRIELDPASFAGQAERETGDGPPPRPLRLKDKTVGEAVGALLQRFDRPDAPLTYVVENGWVVIGTEDRLAARDVKMTRAYEVGDLETPAERLDSGVTWYATVRIRDPLPSRLRELVSETLNAQVYRRQSGGVLQTTVQVADRWLIVHGSAQAQRDAQRLLFMLRNGRLITESRGGASTRPATTTSATQPTTKEGSR